MLRDTLDHCSVLKGLISSREYVVHGEQDFLHVAPSSSASLQSFYPWCRPSDSFF